MNFLEERIQKDGQVREGDILKVDSFLNHQLDIKLLDRIGEAFYEHFKDKRVTPCIDGGIVGNRSGFSCGAHVRSSARLCQKVPQHESGR